MAAHWPKFQATYKTNKNYSAGFLCVFGSLCVMDEEVNAKNGWLFDPIVSLVFRKPTLGINPALTSGYDIVARISMVFTRNDYYGK